MKCTIPEISWHNRDPVLSIDIQPKCISGGGGGGTKVDYHRLASGGTDSHVLIWYIRQNDGSAILDIAADLTRHQRAVNCVRWSPSGEFLASGDDESVIFIWKLKGETETINILDKDTTNDQDKEIWLTYKTLRGHMEDIYDLSWSPNSLNLISGSVDNTARVWDVQRGKSTAILGGHKSFVQGVAWDPKNQYLATLCADRCMRVFDVNTKKIVIRSTKSVLPVGDDSAVKDKIVRLYHDDTLQTFYRRLSFSPDGEIIIAPSGLAELTADKSIHTTYLYTRYNLRQPSIILPSPDEYTVAVRFCPLLFNLHEHTEANPPIISLPYRMIFAVATKSSVYLYDTQQSIPFGCISNIHYTRLTDLTWSNDGQILLVSSTDGFCTLITFADNELGTIYTSTPYSVNDDGEKMIIDDGQGSNNNNKENIVENGNNDTDKDQLESKNIVENGNKDQLESVITNGDESKIVPKQTNSSEIDLTDRIISSDDKFMSPKLKDLPITPIPIRKASEIKKNIVTELSKNDDDLNVNTTSAASRSLTNTLDAVAVTTPKSSNSITDSPTISKQISNENNNICTPPKKESAAGSAKTPRNKNATPISVHRKPRNSTAKKATTKNVDATASKPVTVEDDALDAWPIDQPKPFFTRTESSAQPDLAENVNVQIQNKTIISDPDISPMDVDNTENMRLVMEDSQPSENELLTMTADVVAESSSIVNDSGGGGNGVITPNAKTPRRVEFRTISTPKSKKKLL